MNVQFAKIACLKYYIFAKRNKLLSIILIMLSLFSSLSIAGEGTWPKILKTTQGTLTLYQPQPESYDNETGTIEAKAALSFINKGETVPKFGAIIFTAKYAFDRNSRTALLNNIVINDWKFPNATEEHAKQLENFLNKLISKNGVKTSLDELIHSLKGAENNIKNESKLDNTPPRIIYREHPAALITIDGEPIQKAIDGTTFQRIINTPFIILYDTLTKKYYLNGNNIWFNSNTISGKWTQAQSIPSGLEDTAKAQGLESTAPTSEEANIIPEIIISEKPAELISVNGKPDYSQIDGAGLLYIKNTSSVLILDISEQDYYTLISGRWFTSRSLADGAEWKYVEENKVPQEFYNIPKNDQTDALLSAIPNTPEANEAVLDASIPQTAEVNRNSPSPEISYDGKPEFDNSGVKNVEYAINTPASVIKSGNTYYLCEDAIWYCSDSATGPWEVCIEIPKAIYQIPPSCPVYNTTYVKIYGHTPTIVYIGYTPGYLGSYICNGVVVYGTGYFYRPWYGTYYYPRPVTWGFGVRYNPWSGRWGFGIGYRTWGGGGFYFGIGVGGGWYGSGWRGGWWGRGGYYDRNITINNNININKININDRVRNNIYNGKKNIKTLQERRDSLTPDQRKERKDKLQQKRDGTPADKRQKRKSKITDKRENIGTTNIENTKAKIKNTDTKVKPAINNQIKQNSQKSKETNIRNWNESKLPDNVYTDKNGNIFRSERSTKNWQQLNNNGEWRNAKPSSKTTRQLNQTRQNRSSGAQRNRQATERQRQLNAPKSRARTQNKAPAQRTEGRKRRR